MAKLLALETATAACSVALSVDGEVIDRFRIAPRQHSELLLSFVDEVLSEAGFSLASLDAIAFGCGPGSFMGVRLATGVAQGLAFGADLPVIPVSTLQVLAQAGHEATQALRIIAGWDARMSEFYWGAYALDDEGLMQAVVADQLQAPEGFAPPESETWVAVGNAWEAYPSAFSALNARGISVNEGVSPSARAMLPLAQSQFSKRALFAAEQVEPVYLREKVTS